MLICGVGFLWLTARMDDGSFKIPKYVSLVHVVLQF